MVVFECRNRLIGLSESSCIEDIIGPGELVVSFEPDPPESSWELSISGLAALAERCAFEGRFDKTRLAELQGRGDASIACQIDNSIDRGYHEINFKNRDGAPNSSIGITVTYSR